MNPNREVSCLASLPLAASSVNHSLGLSQVRSPSRHIKAPGHLPWGQQPHGQETGKAEMRTGKGRKERLRKPRYRPKGAAEEVTSRSGGQRWCSPGDKEQSREDDCHLERIIRVSCSFLNK